MSLATARWVTSVTAVALLLVGDHVAGASEERGSVRPDEATDEVSLLRSPPATMLGSAQAPRVQRDGADDFVTPGRRSALSLLRFYRQWVSPIYGARCPMHPSCSAYAVDAIRSSGLFPGAALAADRLLRCGHDRFLYPVVLVDGCHVRLFDPPPVR
jgi:putative membrane protein insertion efficiency factor